MNDLNCPKCNEPLYKGKINTPATPTWTPEKKLALLSGKKFSTYACTECGYMESRLDLKK